MKLIIITFYYYQLFYIYVNFQKDQERFYINSNQTMKWYSLKEKPNL